MHAPAIEEPKPVSKLRWGIHLVIMATLPLLAGVLRFKSSGDHPALPTNAQGLLVFCTFQLVIFAGIFGLAWLASRATKDDLLLRWRPGYWAAPLGLVYSVAIRLAAGLAMIFISAAILLSGIASKEQIAHFAAANRPKVEVLVDLQALTNNPMYFWLNVTLVSMVVAGLREELWRSAFIAGLRSIWPKCFGGTRGSLLAVAIAAVFFGAGHFPQGALAVLLTTVVGFGFGAIMILHRSVWPAVLAHGFFDATSFALIPLASQFIEHLKHAPVPH